jgi:hypothetical protein
MIVELQLLALLAAPPAIGHLQGPGRELSHGDTRTGDLGAPAVFRIAQMPYASYEVVVDAPSGDARPLSLQLLAADLSTVLAQGTAEGTGGSVSLSFRNQSAGVITDQYVRLTGTGCAPCGADDTYRIRLLETTLASPRFNNIPTQRTVVTLFNRGRRVTTGHLDFWSNAGSLIHAEPFTLSPHALLKLEAADMPPLAGLAGSVTVTHTGHYGDIVGKAVAVDTASAFCFDHAFAIRPR